MTTKRGVRSTAALVLIHGLQLAGCEPTSGPRSDSQTNWLRTCETDTDCGGLDCLCGICTLACSEPAACTALQRADCVVADEDASIAACGGQEPPVPGLCLSRCEDGGCDAGEMCVAGACARVPAPTVRIAIEASEEHQVLTGFGATLAYAESDVVEHPSKAELYEAMFAELGLDVFRLQNRFGYADGGNLSAVSELVSAGKASLGREPILVLSSWSPPETLKASGSTVCQGDEDECTLARDSAGGFDYPGFASHWRASLEAYAEVGVVPDYIGIQNNPDFVPSAAAPGEGCRFLPTEGVVTASVGGSEVDVTYPGYDRALAAVAGELTGLESPPGLVAPESSTVQGVAAYASQLDLSMVDALGHHLYGMDPNAVDTDALAALSAFAQDKEKPLFQTEMESDGYGTAVLVHSAMAVEGASAYLHSVLARPVSSSAANSGTLIALARDDFTLEAPYHAIRHFALHTEPGWTRVEATSDSGDLLASAWRSPDGDSLTVVLVNAGEGEVAVVLEFDGQGTMMTQVIRSVFDGVERSRDLGALSAEGIVQLPRRSVVTVAGIR